MVLEDGQGVGAKKGGKVLLIHTVLKPITYIKSSGPTLLSQ